MTVKELKNILDQLDEDKQIYVGILEGGSGQIIVAPVTESCDDPEIIGYVITDRSLEVQ